MIKYNGVRRLGGGGGSVIDVTVYLKLYARPVAVKWEEIHPNFFYSSHKVAPSSLWRFEPPF